MRYRRAGALATGLCASLLACAEPTRPHPPAVPVAAVTPAPTPTPAPPTGPSAKAWICADAPATPLTPALRQEQAAWARRTVLLSHERSIAAVIIDKAGYTLHLYERGERTRSYPVQLGLDPVNDKVMEGDCRTPEGVYRIIASRRPPKTAYARAFLLDYPNFRDYADFIAMRHATRELPLDARIGDNILIHGGGEDARGDAQDGWNWTKGCIALSDENIQDLARHVRVGTPVAIVRDLDGSAKR